MQTFLTFYFVVGLFVFLFEAYIMSEYVDTALIKGLLRGWNLLRLTIEEISAGL
jgi:hypothetical protein